MTLLSAIKERTSYEGYFNTTEILNRESLPLNLEYKQKVQEYFKNKMSNDLSLLRNSNLTPRMMERSEIIVDNMINHMMAKDSWNQETEDKRKYRIMGLDRIRKQTLKDYLPELNSVLKYYD